ncbi:ATP-binding cassette domain-containing protein [Pseudonocardia aurantiaca]|uniref:ABC transporter ATP-binding protein n=1 Tax=Pseudonocardia aurantiaca TaxID=75290 RepID=A0ABW4FS92_9PSEU
MSRSEPRPAQPISLRNVTKRYPAMELPAVADFSMEIEAGEVVAFVGPSGCGKTTTMKMINRLIEPTSGTITIGGEDVGGLDPSALRRRIGYVIQQIGLFPHMTIAQNIGLIPKLLGWSKPEIAARVDELLSLVDLDPATFASRYPRQLSGGQQQRVGVVRALAADPPVLLMDEPFGATDPITRANLHVEFLRLQQEIRKTIVFVTHDFTEAVRLGDRIAVLGPQSRVVQFDTPSAILGAPADDYVASFCGTAPSLSSLGLLPVSAADLLPAGGGHADGPTVRPEDSLRDALDALNRSRAEYLTVVDGTGRAVGLLDYPTLRDCLHRNDALEAIGGGA